MACRVPGCGTKYWNKTKTNRLYRPLTDKQFEEWRKTLARLGVDDFGRNDIVCGLHFTEHDIERHRIEYGPGGHPRLVLLKRIELRHNAVPTIFSSNSKIPRKERSKKLDYAVKMDSSIFEKAQKLRQEASGEEPIIKPKTSLNLKRKLCNNNTEDEIVDVKLLKDIKCEILE